MLMVYADTCRKPLHYIPVKWAPKNSSVCAIRLAYVESEWHVTVGLWYVAAFFSWHIVCHVALSKPLYTDQQ